MKPSKVESVLREQPSSFGDNTAPYGSSQTAIYIIRVCAEVIGIVSGGLQES